MKCRAAIRRLVLAFSFLAFIFLTTPPCPAERDPGQVSFADDVLPLLSDKCFVCHGPDTKDDDMLRLDSFGAATEDRGGYKAVDPADADASELLERILSEDDPMPPADAEKQLTESEKKLLAAWIEQGGKYEQHWAFVAPEKVTPPDSMQVAESAIDRFVAAKLEQQGVAFAEEADRATLARRASLVLTGLPPDLDALQQFLDDKSDDAYEKFVDRLLANPRFGEHQARYWLDAVRYGDTHGLHLDNRRGIYPYRDWVVSAFNSNLSLNDFISWQLAGDLMPDPRLSQLVATGFVRMNPSTAEGGAIAEEFQAKNNFDRVENLGTVLLGMTLTCARCHTHKYDPIPQSEYYQLMAFFNSTAESALDGNQYAYEPTIAAPKDQPAWAAWDLLEAKQAKIVQSPDEELRRSAGLSNMATELVAEWQSSTTGKRFELLVGEPVDSSDAEQRSETGDGSETENDSKSQGQAKEIQPNPFAKLAVHADARMLLAKIRQARSEFTTTLIAKDIAKPRPTFVLDRGEYDQAKGDPLSPGVITVLGDLAEDAPRNRLGLAAWLTSTKHPLVRRVLVNRIWQRVFGQGIVRTPEDFGLQGEQPTHPDLLDWLAVELGDSGWDLKHMLRLMVNSRTFRQSSAWRTDVDDPENRLWTRGPGYRLDAEVIRDIGLWASRLLDPHRGGEGVKPYQPAGMWKAMAHPASNTKEYQRDSGERLYRRSLYVYWKRTSPHPMMTLFDAPDRESGCVRRSRTSTALQSLGLFNETQRIEMGRKLAERVLDEQSGDDERIGLMFRLLASRDPNDSELAACQSLLKTMRQRYSNDLESAKKLLSIGEAKNASQVSPDEHAAWTQVAITVLASDIALLLF